MVINDGSAPGSRDWHRNVGCLEKRAGDTMCNDAYDPVLGHSANDIMRVLRRPIEYSDAG